jgi:hypothetical protein
MPPGVSSEFADSVQLRDVVATEDEFFSCQVMDQFLIRLKAVYQSMAKTFDEGGSCDADYMKSICCEYYLGCTRRLLRSQGVLGSVWKAFIAAILDETVSPPKRGDLVDFQSISRYTNSLFGAFDELSRSYAERLLACFRDEFTVGNSLSARDQEFCEILKHVLLDSEFYRISYEVNDVAALGIRRTFL